MLIASHSSSISSFIADLNREIKWHCILDRLDGIHVSATFLVDGLVRPEICNGMARRAAKATR